MGTMTGVGRFLLGVVSVAICFSQIPAIAQSYSITNLGNLGREFSNATDVNASGQAVGQSLESGTIFTGDRLRAFLYSNGSMSDLGTLGGPTSNAIGMNDNGLVVGEADFATDPTGQSFHAFLYNNGTMTDLGTLGGKTSIANDVNNSGQVTGQADLATGLPNAFLYSGGTKTDLGTLGGNRSGGNSINANGQVVGFALLSNGNEHAFLYSSGTMQDLGTLGGTFSDANAINNNGQVVGGADLSDGTQHAFLYSNGTMIDLGSLGTTSVANDINAEGQIVGDFFGTNSGAFIYTGGKMENLNALVTGPNPFSQLLFAQAISDDGFIVGEGLLDDGSLSAFLLTPEQPVVPEIPETTMLAIVLGSFGCFLAMRRRKLA